MALATRMLNLERGALACFGIVLLITVASLLPAQEPAAVEERVEVRLVNLDVYVSDSRGRPIYGLGPEDFLVWEDGAPVEITYFEAPTPSTGDGPGPSEGRDVATAPVPAPAAVESDRILAIFLDDLAIDPSQRRQVLADLERALAEREGRFALFVNRDQLALEVPPTLDSGEVLAALDAVGPPPTGSVRDRIDRRTSLRVIEQAYVMCEQQPFCTPCTDAYGEMLSEARNYAAEIETRNLRTLSRLRQALAILGSESDQKALMMVTQGIAMRPGVEMLHYVQDLCPERQMEIQGLMYEADQISLLNRIAALANQSRVTLFMIEARQPNVDQADVGFADRRFMPSNENRQMREANIQGSLELLARETGGAASLAPGSAYDGFETVVQRLQDTYTLAYEPPHEASGSTHLVKVELRKGAAKRADLLYRRTYYDKTEEEILADNLLGLLFTGAERNPLQVDAELLPPAPGEETAVLIPVRLELPAATVERLYRYGEPAQRLRVWMMVADGYRRPTDVRQQRVDLPAPGQALSLTVDMELTSGIEFVAIGVRDEVTGEASYLRREIPGLD